ncbi:MAG: hypothetical protein RSC98_07715, partial [Clostridia bacterium]
SDGCTFFTVDKKFVYDIINNNRFNQDPTKYACIKCGTVNDLTDSYISYVCEDDFLKDPSMYIDGAYDKSKNDASGYTMTRER